MNNFILRFAVMLLTFALGLAGNFLFNGLSSIAERWIESPDPVLQEPVVTIMARPAISLFTPSCSQLVVEVAPDGGLRLNGERMGNIHNPSKLVATLNEVFRQRTELHAFRPGFELTSAIPEEERIEKTVLVKANSWICYSDVSDLIEVIRMTGAMPVLLVTEGPFTADPSALEYP